MVQTKRKPTKLLLECAVRWEWHLCYLARSRHHIHPLQIGFLPRPVSRVILFLCQPICIGRHDVARLHLGKLVRLRNHPYLVPCVLLSCFPLIPNRVHFSIWRYSAWVMGISMTLIGSLFVFDGVLCHRSTATVSQLSGLVPARADLTEC